MTPRRVLGRLWSRQKLTVTVICVLIDAPPGEELRIVRSDAEDESIRCVDRAEALQRADRLRLQFDAQGWV